MHWEDNLHYEKLDKSIECIEHEIPFEIPESWGWARFSSITLNRDNERKPVSSKSRKDVEKKYDYYGASGAIDKINSYIFNEKLLLIGEDGANLVTRSKPIAFFAEGKYWVNNHAHCIDSTDKRYLDFLCTYINAINLEKYITGSAQPKMTQDNMNSIIVPVPPIQEQIRINAHLYNIFSMVSYLEDNKTNIKGLILNTKLKILDLAICGKLVPQDPNDEPASILLERIRTEKEELIKHGKIRPNKKESIIYLGDDNSYYENIPDAWEIASLNSITTPLILNDGDWILSENMSKDGIVKLIQLGSIGNMEYINKGFKYLTEDTFNKLSCTQIYSGYMLINRIINDKMNVCILPELEGKLITTVDTCWIAPKEDSYCLNYLLYAISSSTFQRSVLMNSSGTTRKRISKNNLISIPIPIPPLYEQRKIAKTIEIYFKQLDKILEILA